MCVFTQMEEVQYLLCVWKEFFLKASYPRGAIAKQHGLFVASIAITLCKGEKVLFEF